MTILTATFPAVCACNHVLLHTPTSNTELTLCVARTTVVSSCSYNGVPKAALNLPGNHMLSCRSNPSCSVDRFCSSGTHKVKHATTGSYTMHAMRHAVCRGRHARKRSVPPLRPLSGPVSSGWPPVATNRRQTKSIWWCDCSQKKTPNEHELDHMQTTKTYRIRLLIHNTLGVILACR